MGKFVSLIDTYTVFGVYSKGSLVHNIGVNFYAQFMNFQVL